MNANKFDKKGKWMNGRKKSDHGSLPNQKVPGRSLQKWAEEHFWESRAKHEVTPKMIVSQSLTGLYREIIRGFFLVPEYMDSLSTFISPSVR